MSTTSACPAGRYHGPCIKVGEDRPELRCTVCGTEFILRILARQNRLEDERNGICAPIKPRPTTTP